MSAPSGTVIAVVDDDPTLLALLDELLTTEGYRVVTEHNGARAVDFIARERPALLILDLWLQGAEEAGVEIVRTLRAVPDTAHLPIIVCSAAAHVLARHGDTLRGAGCVLLPKPFHLGDLLAHIAAILSGSQ